MLRDRVEGMRRVYRERRAFKDVIPNALKNLYSGRPCPITVKGCACQKLLEASVGAVDAVKAQ